MPLSPPELIAMHLENLYEVDRRGRSMRTRESGGDASPRFVLIRSRAGHAWLAGAAVPDTMAARLGALAAREPRVESRWPAADPEYRKLLDSEAHSGVAYLLPAELPPSADATEIGPDDVGLLERYFPVTAATYDDRRPVFGIVADGAVVSRCCSARLPSAAVEAGVDTAEGYRRRGYAVQVTAAWARALHRRGRLPLYSTQWENVASRRVAARLGARRYAVSYEAG